MYAPSEEPADETAAKSPSDPYARSKLEGEEAAFSFRDPARFEVYSLRPAMVSGVLSRYGSGLIMRLIYEGYLVGPPQKRGMKGAVVNVRDVASCAYLLAAKTPGIPCSSPCARSWMTTSKKPWTRSAWAPIRCRRWAASTTHGCSRICGKIPMPKSCSTRTSTASSLE